MGKDKDATDERCLAAVDIHLLCIENGASATVERPPPARGSVVVSTHFFYVFTTLEESVTLGLLGKHTWRAVRRIDVQPGWCAFFTLRKNRL